MTSTDQTHKAAPRPEAVPTPRRRARVVRHGLRGLLLIVLIPVLFSIAGAALMFGREITAPSWIRDRVEVEARKLLGGGAVEFSDITLTVGADLHPKVRLAGTVLTDANGRVLARVPSIDAVISPRGLVLRREVLVQTVDLSGAQVSVRRNADGSVALAFDTSAQAVGEAPSFAELLDEVDQIFERPALEALKQVRAEGLVLTYLDARAGRNWTVDGGALSLDLDNRETHLSSTLSLLSGRDFVTLATLDYRSPRGSREAEIDLNVSDVMAADIASQSPALSWLGVVDAKMTAVLGARLESDGTLGPFRADLRIGAGQISPEGAAEPLPFDSAEAALTYDPVAGRIAFERISAQTGWGGFTGAGRAELQNMNNGWPEAIVSQLDLSDLSINPPGLYEQPLEIAGAKVDTRLTLRPFRLEIGQAQLGLGDDQLNARAVVAADQEGWRASLDLETPTLGLEQLLSLWPRTRLPGTRTWLENNVSGGQLADLSASLRIAPGEKPRYAVTSRIAADRLTYMATLPPLEQTRGFAVIGDNALTIRVDRGHVTAPQGGRVDLAGSVFGISDLRVLPSRAEIRLATDSTVTAALSILDLPPFQYLTRAGLPITLADGRARASGTIRLPIKPPPLMPGDVSFDLAARLEDVSSQTLVPGHSLTATALDVLANPVDGLVISGPARVGGVTARGRFHRALGPGVSPVSTVEAEVTLGRAFLDEFNIGLPDGTVGGSGPGSLEIRLEPDVTPRFTLGSALDGITLALPAVGWSKPAGRSGSLSVEGQLGAPPVIDRIALDAAGLSAAGSLTIAANGGLDRAQFDRVSIGDWFDAPVILRGRGANRAVGIEIGGGTLDLRRASLGDSGGQGGPMALRLDRLQVSEGIALTGFEGDFDASGGFSGSFAARLNEDTPVRGTVVPYQGRSAVRIRSDDAGGAFRSVGLIKNASGGDLTLTLVPTGAEGNYEGELAVTDLRVKDAPALAGLLDAISVVGLLQQMDGQGLAFTSVDARFRITPDQIIVGQSSAVGPGLGISMDGTYTLASKLMDFQGVVSPLFLINGIGAVLTRRGEGLIGFNYTLRGPVDAAQVGVNPLSVLTPGMFRNIFRRPPPDLSQ